MIDRDTEIIVRKHAYLDAMRAGLSWEQGELLATKRLRNLEYGPYINSTAVTTHTKTSQIESEQTDKDCP